MRDEELVRKIGLTPKQRKQLDALARKHFAGMMQADREAHENLQKSVKEIQSLPKEKQEESANALFADDQRRREQWREQNRKDLRKKIEALLTPKQLRDSQRPCVPRTRVL